MTCPRGDDHKKAQKKIDNKGKKAWEESLASLVPLSRWYEALQNGQQRISIPTEKECFFRNVRMIWTEEAEGNWFKLDLEVFSNI